MPTLPYLRTQKEILDEVNALIRNTSEARWTDEEVYLAINQALATWADKVKLPFLYTIASGYGDTTYEYVLPAYVRPPLYPEVYRDEPYDRYYNDLTNNVWQELMGWEYNVAGDGTGVLHVYRPRNLDGRLWFYAPNSRVPLTSTLPVTSGSTAADATSVVLSTVVDVDDVGYIKIDSEYMSYAGVTRGASTTTLLNVTRALNGSAAATHDSGTTVYWCVAVDTLALYRLMYDQMRVVLAAMPLFDGGTHERLQYEKQLGLYRDMAEQYWATYKPDRPNTSIKLNRKAFALR